MKPGDDITDLQIRSLSEDFKKPFFITEWPKDMRPFYMLQNPDNPKTVLNADLIAPGESGGEIIGGSARESDPAKILAKLEQEGTDPENYGWYMDIRRFGSFPHAGFGMGVERLTQWICNVDHIRDCIAFPRTMNRVYP